MFSLAEFQTKLTNALQANRSELLSKFNEIAKKKLNPRIDILEFQAFDEPTRYEISIRLFLMDKNWNEVFNNSDETEYVDSSLEVLRINDYFDYPLHQIDERYYEDMDHIVDTRLTDFISAVYDKSDFSKIKQEVYFYIHDSSKRFDLKNKCSILLL